MLSDDQIVAAMGMLGVSYEELCSALEDPTPDALNDLKRRARLNYKRAALDLHPDRTGGDPAKTEMFHAVSELLSEVSDLSHKPTQRRMKFKITFGRKHA